jgi:hypothetical protein
VSPPAHFESLGRDLRSHAKDGSSAQSKANSDQRNDIQEACQLRLEEIRLDSNRRNLPVNGPFFVDAHLVSGRLLIN